ncbi:hypothetical protein ABPG72_008599 [Tetrahymena utriculariae]
MSTSKEPSKKENLWNNILNETGQKNKYQNKQVLVLGTRGTGKRTLIDSLHEISQTIYPKIRSNEMQSGKLRIAGSVSALDYVYLNVKNLDDQDEDTMAKLGVYIIDEETQNQLLPIVLKQNTVKDTLITIMLDLSEPWTFMEQLDKWIEMITNHFQSLQISLEILDQMRAKVEKQFRDYKEPVLSSDGKLVNKSDSQISPEEELELTKLKSSVPLPEGSLTSNLGIPIVIVANKSDLIAQNNDQQSQIILYYLRKYCLQYGASLIFTSSKNLESLQIYYDYMLHTLYGFTNKNKSEIYTIESIFIPSGSDNLNLLKQSNSNIYEQCNSKPYEEQVKRPTSKNQRQEEVVCEDEQEFLKNLINDKSNPEPVQSAKSSISAILQSGASSTSTRTVNPPKIGNQGGTSVSIFYQTLLNQPNDARRLRENAERDLQQRVGNSANNYFRNDEIYKESFQSIKHWLTEAKENSEESATFFLVGAQSDREKERKVTREEAEQFQKDNQIDLFFEVSSKNNILIDECFEKLAQAAFMKQINQHLKKSFQGSSFISNNGNIRSHNQSVPIKEQSRRSKNKSGCC